jgi:probable F420-dependent oxidoreductase
MKFGTGSMVGPRRWADLARAAEAAGFESIWIPEHLVMPVAMTGKPNSPSDGEPPISAATPAYDPWVQMATMAAVTDTIKFGTWVYNLGLRHPIITARSLTTVDNVSRGRVILGIGASWLRQEWEVMELPFETRGRRIDEAIGLIRRLFSEEEISHDGEFFSFPAVGFLPKPVQEAGPPMLIGGDSRAAMRRAAHLGDGWIPMEQTLETIPANLAQIQAMRSEAGRSGDFEVTMAAQVATVDDVRRFEDAGVTRLILSFNPRDPDAFGRFADEIISKL